MIVFTAGSSRWSKKTCFKAEELWSLEDPFERFQYRASMQGCSIWGSSNVKGNIVQMFLWMSSLLIPCTIGFLVMRYGHFEFGLGLFILLPFVSVIWLTATVMKLPARHQEQWIKSRNSIAKEFYVDINKTIVELVAQMYSVPPEMIRLDDNEQTLRPLHRWWRSPLQSELEYGLGLVYGSQYDAEILREVTENVVNQLPKSVGEMAGFIEEELSRSVQRG